MIYFQIFTTFRYKSLKNSNTIVVPEPETPPATGGGFDPEVSDWENEEHQIEF